MPWESKAHAGLSFDHKDTTLAALSTVKIRTPTHDPSRGAARLSRTSLQAAATRAPRAAQRPRRTRFVPGTRSQRDRSGSAWERQAAAQGSQRDPPLATSCRHFGAPLRAPQRAPARAPCSCSCPSSCHLSPPSQAPPWPRGSCARSPARCAGRSRAGRAAARLRRQAPPAPSHLSSRAPWAAAGEEYVGCRRSGEGRRRSAASMPARSRFRQAPTGNSSPRLALVSGLCSRIVDDTDDQ